MIYRMVGEERMPQVQALWDYCFEKKDTPFFQYYFQEYCGKDNMVIGGFEKLGEREVLRNMLNLNPYMLRIRGKEQLVPYIVGVATAPEARGQHLFAPLLETTFEVLRSQGYTFATLMPINAGIYLPYEFSYYCYRHAYKMPLASLQLPKTGSELAVERCELSAEAAAVLAPLYERLTAACNGVPKRTAFQWKKLLTVSALENTQCAVVYREDEAAGYMLYTISEGIFNVVELLARDFAAKNRLLRYAAQHKSEAQEFSWLAEAWDTTYLYFTDQSLTGSLQPFMMARCLDARAALAQLSAPADMPEGELVLLLTDSVIERNNHLLLLRTAPGRLEAVSTIAEEEVTMDMGAFTQLYLGAFSATELWEAGRIKCAQPEKLQLLDRLLPKCRNYINEYF